MAWAAIAAAAVQAIGAIQQGKAESASLKAQANAQDYNARIQRDNAAQVSREASLKEDTLRRQQALFLGKQRASIGEAGTGGLETGSGIDLRRDSTEQAELDDLTVRYEGNTQRRALLQDATMNTYQAGVSRMNAKSAKQAGYISALGSMLGGMGRYQSMQNAKPGTK